LFDRVLAKDPDDANALVKKGVSLGYQGKHDEAIALFDRVLAKDPDDANALVKKGVSLGYQGKHDEAIALFDRVLAKDPDDANALVKKVSLWVIKASTTRQLLAMTRCSQRIPKM